MVETDRTQRLISYFARTITIAPWDLRGGDLDSAAYAALSGDKVLHALALASLFGYLNRVADAIGIELDYDVTELPLPPDPATPPLARLDPKSWPTGDPAISTARLPGLDDALASWREHALERDAPLTRAQRHAIAATVAAALGDVSVEAAADPDPALVAFADLATLAPWRLGAAALAPLRAAGFANDEVLFDVIATTAFATLASRLRVALTAMALR